MVSQRLSAFWNKTTVVQHNRAQSGSDWPQGTIRDFFRSDFSTFWLGEKCYLHWKYLCLSSGNVCKIQFTYCLTTTDWLLHSISWGWCIYCELNGYWWLIKLKFQKSSFLILLLMNHIGFVSGWCKLVSWSFPLQPVFIWWFFKLVFFVVLYIWPFSLMKLRNLVDKEDQSDLFTHHIISCPHAATKYPLNRTGNIN